MEVTKKILLVFPTIHRGGAEKFVISIFNKLSELNEYEIYVLSLDGIIDLNLDVSFKINLLRGSFDFSNLFKRVFQVNKVLIPHFLNDICTKYNIDVIVSGYEYDVEQYLILLKRNFGRKNQKYFSLIQTDIKSKIKDLPFWRRFTYSIVDKLREKHFDRIILCAESIKSRMLINSLSKYVTIPNSIDTKLIDKKIKFSQLGSTRSICNGKQYFLAVSRYSKQKNLIVMLQAFYKIIDDCDLYLIIVGHISEIEEYRAIKNYLSSNRLEKRVLTLEYFEDIYGLIQNASAVVTTSKYEGFPLALLEAMYLKVPIIATRFVAHEDLLSDQNSFLCDDYSADSLARLMIKCINDEQLVSTKLENAYKFASKHDISKSVNAYKEILSRV